MTTAAAEPDGIGGGFCRVQIAGPTTRVDLAVPTAVPLAALLPSIVSFAEQDAAAPQGWALSRLDGARLDPAAALTVAGIREGELLLLHPARDRVGEPLYDDVVEVLGEGAAESGWSPRDTRAAAAVLGGGAAMSHAAGDVPAGTVLGALAALTGAAFGVVLLGPPFGAAHVVVAAAVAVLVAATGPALVDGGDAVFVGLGLTALLGLL
ncbi:MAG: EsaB/YukD family protein, partial [Pseudonocardia sp.]